MKSYQECLGCGEDFFGSGEYCDTCTALVKPSRVLRDRPRFRKEENISQNKDNKKRFSNRRAGV